MKHGPFNMVPKTKDKVCNGNSRHISTEGSSHVEITNGDNAH